MKECQDIVRRHEAAALEEYVDDGAFRLLVSEMLDTKVSVFVLLCQLLRQYLYFYTSVFLRRSMWMIVPSVACERDA